MLHLVQILQAASAEEEDGGGELICCCTDHEDKMLNPPRDFQGLEPSHVYTLRRVGINKVLIKNFNMQDLPASSCRKRETCLSISFLVVLW